MASTEAATSTSLVAARVGVAGNAVNLHAAVLNALAPTSTLANMTSSVLKWLYRERLDESSFLAFSERAQSLAYPNGNGLQIHKSLDEAESKIKRIKNSPLQIVLPGAPGRILAKDPNLCYLVSTVACLTKFHDMEYAADAICSMIFDRGGHQDYVQLRYEVLRAPIRAVVSKVVDSIFLNVVNSGHQIPPLPETLRHLHPHLLRDGAFAGIAMGIQRTEGDVVLLSDPFSVDIATWLFSHFEGIVEVSVAGELLFCKALGGSSRRIQMICRTRCPPDQENCRDAIGVVKASVWTGQQFTIFLQHSSDFKRHPRSYTRRKLYQTDGRTSPIDSNLTTKLTGKLASLNFKERDDVRAVAKQMLTWLLQTPLKLERWSENFDLSFQASWDDEDANHSLRLRDVLVAHPALLQINTGTLNHSGPTFNYVSDECTLVDTESLNESSDEGVRNGSDATPEDVIQHFPPAVTMLHDVQKRCECSNCRINPEHRRRKKGCRRYAAVAELFILLAHAISDGFNATDVSGQSYPQSQIKGVTAVFTQLINQRLVQWNIWFKLVVSTVTGRAWEDVASYWVQNREENVVSTWVAAQYGALVLAAPWLDLSKPKTARGCFALNISEGHLAGVSDDFALVRSDTDPYRRNQNRPGNPVKPPKPSAWEEHMDSDGVATVVQQVMFRTEEQLYLLMNLVKTDQHVHLVDPAGALRGSICAKRIRCSHADSNVDRDASDTQGQVHLNPFTIEYLSFDDLLQDQRTLGNFEHSHVLISQPLDSYIKINTLLSMPSMGIVLIQPWNACQHCTLWHVQAAQVAQAAPSVQATRPSLPNSCHIITDAVNNHTTRMITHSN